jgi:ABC-type bacteriocin/lantibiotic exporter with double-glycine peptidase domain
MKVSKSKYPEFYGRLHEIKSILHAKDLKRIYLVIFVQVILGFVDLLGVALIGILGALTVRGVQSQSPGDRVSRVLEFTNLDGTSFQFQVALLAGAATFILVSRTILSIFFTRRILFFLSRRSAVLSARMVANLLREPITQIQKRTNQETLYAVTSGVNSVTLGIIGTFVSVVSDTTIMMVLMLGLFLFNPLVAATSLLIFFLVGLAIYHLLKGRAQILGLAESSLTIASGEKITEVLDTYREAIVRDRRSYYSGEIEKIRFQLSDTMAELTFMPNISKYIIEVVVVIGALSISAIQFITQDASHAVATLAIYLTAGSRIAPAVLRIQQGALQIKGSLSASKPTLDLLKELHDYPTEENPKRTDYVNHHGFDAKVEIRDLSFEYSTTEKFAIQNVNLDIEAGSVVSFVGSSGSGKTTLADLILGVLTPNSGEVLISGKSPHESIKLFPGAIGYVPQSVVVINGSIRDNVTLGYPKIDFSDELVLSALEKAQLTEFTESQPEGIYSLVGDKGSKLSGGQRQRLGIARALLTNPKLLVLDEATSALDAKTEDSISRTIYELKGETTVLLIAHRLSIARKSNKVVYLNQGKIEFAGTFEEVREAVPEFEIQAKLMGL